MTLYSFLSLIVVGLFLPSDGNHGLLAPKSLAFFAAAFFFFCYFITQTRLLSHQVYAVFFVAAALFFLGVFAMVGIDQNPLIKSGQFDQFKIFMTTLFPPVASWYLIKSRVVLFEQIMKTAIWTNFAYNLMKVGLMVLHVGGVINVWSFMAQTGFRFMSMHIIGDLGRIQTSVDIITPFLTYFVLQSDPLNLKLSNRFKKLYCLIAAGSVFLSFSRFLCFVFFVSLVLHVFTLRYFQQLKIWVLALAVTFIAVAAIGPSFVMEVVEKRFFSADNASSDRVRQEQVSAMMRVCDEHPFFGNGLGGYTQECIRDHEIPHAYEVQWVAFLMQFGLVGCMILLVPLGLIAWNFISYPWSRSKWGYFLLFCLWIFSGFTNPFLISLTSGIIYMMFWLIGQRLSAKSFLC